MRCPAGEETRDRREGPDPRMVHVWALKALAGPLLSWALLVVPIAYAASMDPSVPVDRRVLVVLSLVLIAVLLVVAYTWADLYLRSYRWSLGDEEVRIWRGILFRARITIPYSRVQNVNVVRGPLLILVKLSSVEIETAGQKGMYSRGAYRCEGYLPGIVGGEGIADFIVDRMKAVTARGGP